MLHPVVIMLEGRSGVVGWIDKYALHLTPDCRVGLQRLQCQEIIAMDQKVVEDVAVAAGLGELLEAVYRANATTAPFSPDAEQAGRRALRNAALAYLAAPRDGRAAALLDAQYRGADNMTDRMAALSLLVEIEGPERSAALACSRPSAASAALGAGLAAGTSGVGLGSWARPTATC